MPSLIPLSLKILTVPTLLAGAALVHPGTPEPVEAPRFSARLVFGDIDGDGLREALTVDAGASPRLLRPQSGGRFEDVTRFAGLDLRTPLAHASLEDMDGDGAAELVAIDVEGAVHLYRNDGSGHLQDVTAMSGLVSTSPARAARLLDFDGDGLVDLLLQRDGLFELHHNLGESFRPVDLEFSATGTTPEPGGRAVTWPLDEPASESSRRSLGTAIGTQPSGQPGAASSASTSAARTVTGGTTSTGHRKLGPAYAPLCASALSDEAASGSCLSASSQPVEGSLFPLGHDFFVNPFGRIGMGTTSPGARLHVVGGAPRIRVAPDFAGGSSYLQLLEENSDSTDFANLTGMQLELDGFDERFRIQSLPDLDTWFAVDATSGRVGVGTDQPGARLHVVGTNPRLRVAPAGVGSSYIQWLGEASVSTSLLDLTGYQAGFDRTLDRFALQQLPSQRVDLAVDYATGQVGVGRSTPEGTLHVQANGGTTSVLVSSASSGGNAELFLSENGLGTNGVGLRYAGDVNELQIFGRNGDDLGPQMVIRRSGRVGISTEGPATTCTGVALKVTGGITTDVLQLSGGCDLVEGFETVERDCEPGTVMVIDSERPGRLTASSQAYDARVAGVVSGAGDVKHGLRMGQAGVMDGDTLVALTGRVYVRASAENGPISPGDLMTTAETPGHAMLASDRERGFGAVIGKAMTALESGTGLVLVLVNLQ